MDIIATMAKYNLTLRHVPEKEVSFYEDRGRELKENEERVIWHRRNGEEWKMVKETRIRKISEWLCIVDKSFNDTQYWSRAFHGDTAEEAVNMAVEYIESKNNA